MYHKCLIFWQLDLLPRYETEYFVAACDDYRGNLSGDAMDFLTVVNVGDAPPRACQMRKTYAPPYAQAIGLAVTSGGAIAAVPENQGVWAYIRRANSFFLNKRRPLG